MQQGKLVATYTIDLVTPPRPVARVSRGYLRERPTGVFAPWSPLAGASEKCPQLTGKISHLKGQKGSCSWSGGACQKDLPHEPLFCWVEMAVRTPRCSQLVGGMQSPRKRTCVGRDCRSTKQQLPLSNGMNFSKFEGIWVNSRLAVNF